MRAHGGSARPRRRRAVTDPAPRRPRASLGADSPRPVLEDLFLRLQRAIDRMIRRLRLGPPPTAGRRRLLIVQIDGLSRAVLEQALSTGYMPFLRSLLYREGYRLRPMTVGIPTSTPAFQMAAMYGVMPDIPGFHFHDKRRRTDIHFPRAGHAAFVEAEQARGRAGILAGGSVYGCVFTGGAANDFFSFARLTRPRAAGLARVLSAFVVLAWVAAKCATFTVNELVRLAGRIVRRPSQRERAWKLAKKRIAISVWMREWFTCAVARDIYDGVPAIYVNYLDHDETAHAVGPRDREALAALHGVDRSLRQIRRVLRRVPEHRYDLYVLSDHGQASCTPYRALTAGQPFERAFFDQVLGWAPPEAQSPPGEASASASTGTPTGRARTGVAAAVPPAEASAVAAGHDLGFEPYLDVRESCERNGIRVVSAGPNAFVYFVDTSEPVPLETIEARYPGLATALSKSDGVGVVIARAAGGPVCFWRGQCQRLEDSDGGPFAERPDREIVSRDLARLMTMRCAGDLVVYGIDAPDGHVSYIDEVGAHAGASPDELHTFIAAPEGATLPDRIDHPLQLYDVFIRYQTETGPPIG